MSEDLVRQLALWAAGAIAALWGGSKVPWKALIARLLGGLKTAPAVAVAEASDARPDVHAAFYVLRTNAPNAEFQKLVDACESAYWQGAK